MSWGWSESAGSRHQGEVLDRLAARLTGQKEQGISHLVRRQHGTAVKATGDGFAVPQWRVHRTEGEGGDANAVLSFLGRKAATEADQGGLAGAVGPPVAERVVSGMAAHIDDQAAACLAKGRKDGLADLKHTGEIELQKPLPAVQRHLRQRSGPGGAGIVDDHLGDWAPVAKIANGRGDRRAVAEIELAGFHVAATLAKFSRQIIQWAEGSGDKPEVVTGCCQAAGCGSANTPRCTGDEGDRQWQNLGGLILRDSDHLLKGQASRNRPMLRNLA